MFTSTIRRVGYALSLLGMVLACKPRPDLIISPEPVKSGIPTAIGKPLGTLVSKTIGSTGGTLTSADGTMTLTFPAGALSKETLITAQPIENTAPGGAGPGYEFGPHDTQFARPVTMTWTYKPTDLRNTSPDAMGIAYQDDNNVWQGHTNLKIDTASHLVSASLKHFSRYSYFEHLWLVPIKWVLAPNESLDLKVAHIENFPTPARNPGPDDADLLEPLSLHTYLETSKGEIKNWKVNGQDVIDKPESSVGMLSFGEGAVVRYKAPTIVPDNNPVDVSVEVPIKGKRKMVLISNLTIESANELFINGSKLKTVYVVANLSDYGAEVSLSEQPRDRDKQANVFLQLLGKGVGTYALSKENEVKVALSATDAQNVNYYYTYMPDGGSRIYGPGSVTITEYDVKSQLIAGSFSATLHYYNREKKEHKSVKVSGKFRSGGA